MKQLGKDLIRFYGKFGSKLSGKALHLRDKAHPEMDQFCAVYVIAGENGHPVKIGIARDCNRRAATLQISRWEDDRLIVWEAFWMRDRIDARRVERFCHDFLTAENKALAGEWFDIRAEQAVKVVRAAIKKLQMHWPEADPRYTQKDFATYEWKVGETIGLLRKPKRVLAKLGKFC